LPKRTADALGWKGERSRRQPFRSQSACNDWRHQEHHHTHDLFRERAFNADGSAVLLTSSVDMGQGALTSLAQIVADELGLPSESPCSPDTDMTPHKSKLEPTTFYMEAAQKAARRFATSCSMSPPEHRRRRRFRTEKTAALGRAGKRLSITEILKPDSARPWAACLASLLKTEGGLNPKTGKAGRRRFGFSLRG
jgi:CO/xanthine dehydrogenase Mo-binding subunit